MLERSRDNMDRNLDITLVIPTCPLRVEKLRALLRGVASTSSDRDRFEVIVVVDGEDEHSPDLAAELPADIQFRAFSQEQQGPARARNLGIEHARGRWLLFFDDDALIDAETIPGHLERIRQNHELALAYLGRVDWPAKLLTSQWTRLLARTSMLFFWDKMKPDRTYGFRHFWTSNLCVRTDWVREVGGFDESFPSALHEDIELGWRLQQRFGVGVRPVMTINSWHDHAITPAEYFNREHRSGATAASCRTINPDFHDAVWGWLRDPQQTADTLRSTLAGQAGQVLDMLESWTESSDYQPTPDELQAAYLAHLPLKRMMFCCGYAGVPFDEAWGEIRPAAKRESADPAARLEAATVNAS